jgi:hypothetical protein
MRIFMLEHCICAFAGPSSEVLEAMLGMQVLDIEREDARIDALQPAERKL